MEYKARLTVTYDYSDESEIKTFVVLFKNKEQFDDMEEDGFEELKDAFMDDLPTESLITNVEAEEAEDYESFNIDASYW